MKKRRPRPIKVALFVFLLILVSFLALYFFLSGPREKVRVSQQPEGSMTKTEKGEIAQRQVTLFFPSENDDYLHPELREISVGPPEIEAQEIIQELIAGSKEGYLSPLPLEARVRQVFITPDGTAYVDFSREVIEKHPSGSAAELTTIYSVVNSLIHNIPTIKQVFFLIEGSERETLSGHINLSQPFTPMPSIVAR